MNADSDNFTDAYIPTLLPCREEYLRQIRTYLSSVISSRHPSHLWIYGPSGSGKTACVTAALKEMEKAKGYYRWIILNCWIDNTLYALTDRMSREWRVLDAHEVNTISKLRAVKKFLADKPVVIVLDEADKLPPNERNKVLYNLAALGRVSLICISNSNDSASELEERVLSRLSLATMHFEPYTAPEIMRILNSRPECMLYSAEAIERIARLAGGDMRAALRLLKSAIQIAEREKSSLSKKHVDDAFKVRPKSDAGSLAKMGEHERLIYGLIEDNAGIQSKDLWKAYKELCQQKNIEAIAERTFHRTLHRLKNVYLIRWTWTISGLGRWRAFWPHSAQMPGEEKAFV